MIDDDHLLTRIQDEFRWDPRLREAEVAIGVKDRIASLSGTVATNAIKQAAARAAERVAGVSAVANAIQIVPHGAHVRTDTELAHAVVRALEWNALVPQQDVRARIDRGWVILEGRVEWAYQRDEAEVAVCNLIGVRGVTNLIEVINRVDPAAVAKGIREALARQAIEDAGGIEVEPHGDTVILRGTVGSLAERDLAERAARNSGLVEVQNEILIREMPVA